MIDIKKQCPELDLMLKEEVIEPFDVEFARIISLIEGKTSRELAIVSSLVSRLRRDGHVCVDMKELLNTGSENALIALPFKIDEEFINKLLNTESIVKPGIRGPLVLDQELRIYLYRFWMYEQILADAIKKRAMNDLSIPDKNRIKNRMDQLFAETDQYDWQKIASAMALKKRFCAISGGPGTGKTHLIFTIILLLSDLNPEQDINIALLAPTGKASARMKDAFKNRYSLIQDMKKNVALPYTSTIHRFLIGLKLKRRFENLPEKPDIVFVDEASMVDLELMTRLIQALPEHCQIILTGDKDQLSSVEAGAVFSDICPQERTNSFSPAMCSYLNEATGYNLVSSADKSESMGDCIVNLERNYRFSAESGIYHLSSAVRGGNWDCAISVLKDHRYPDVTWRRINSVQMLHMNIRKMVIENFRKLHNIFTPFDAIRILDSFRILTPLREGPFGTVAINRFIENILIRQTVGDIINEWYHGKPIIITRNNYELELFNGDTGIILKDTPASSELSAYFTSEDNTFRRFHPMVLPDCETAYVMTVHKSQGSEFERVILVLPDRDSPLLTKELIYTAITRAKESVEIWGKEDILKSAISRKTRRLSGLKDLLWK